MTSHFVPDHRVREGYRCCNSCERILPLTAFEEYGSGYRRVCRDCRAISETMRAWPAEHTSEDDA